MEKKTILLGSSIRSLHDLVDNNTLKLSHIWKGIVSKGIKNERV